MAARRGLSRSSIPGLAENSVTQGLSGQLGQIEAKRAGMLRDLDIQNAQLAFNPAIQVSQANPMNVPLQDLPGGPRSGGLAGLAGTAMQGYAAMKGK
jgi:hypothetical protein